MPSAIRIKTTAGWQDIAVQGPPSGQMQLIEEKLLAAAASSFDFQNIPQTFSHLMLIGDVENVTGGTGVRVRFNNDSGNNYLHAGVYNTASAAAAEVQSTGTSGSRIAASFGAGGSQFTAHIPSYRSAFYKGFTSQAVNWEATFPSLRSYAGRWSGTAAINRITIYCESGANFSAGCRVSLYGILAQPEVQGPPSPLAGAHPSVNQTITSTMAKLLFDVEEFDTHGAYNPTTSEFTVPIAGYYRVSAFFGLANSAATLAQFYVELRIGGVNYRRFVDHGMIASAAVALGSFGEVIVSLAAGNVVTLYGATTGGNIAMYGGSLANISTRLQIEYLRP